VRAPTFTVVIAAYNSARTIAPAIQSVLAQSERDFELIVVDDGSTDDTGDRVRPFLADRRVSLVQQENQGVAGARNAGFARASADYVSLLDGDDLWLPTYLTRMGTALEATPQAGLAYTDAWLLDDESRRVLRSTAMAHQRPPETPPEDAEALLSLLVENNFVFSSATIRRSAYEVVGPFDLRAQPADDYEMWMRLAANGFHAARARGTLAVYRLRPDAVSRNEALMFRSIKEALRIVADEYGASEAIQRRARSKIREYDAYLSPYGRARRRARRGARRLVDLVLRRDVFYDAPPPEVAVAFPDLSAV
jgi:glycosyltransferase involved in cell wall biosynthesis